MHRQSLAVGMVMLVIAAACAGAAGPSAASRPSASAAIAVVSSPSPKPTPRSTPRPTPGPSSVPGPVDSVVDGVTIRTLALRADSAPIDVAVAFGSVWVANHHGATVTRLDPMSMRVQATIEVGDGPGWFAATDDALWVSNQMGRGMTMIDPGTNTAVGGGGSWATCGRPISALGSVWQPACDAHRIMRIDPRTASAVDVEADGRFGIVLANGTLIVGGRAGLARLDPKTGAFTEIGGPDGWVFAFDGRTVWSSNDQETFRIRPADGSVVATIPLGQTGSVVFRGGHAWLPTAAGLVEIDLTTSKVIRTLELGPVTAVAVDDSAIWATSYDRNTILRISP